MRKTLLLTLPLFLVFLFGGLMGNYAEVGQWLYNSSMAMESKSAGLEARKADIGEMEMSYYIHENSTKPTLVMLYGYSTVSYVALCCAKHFAEDYQIVIPQMAGHGEIAAHESWSVSRPAYVKSVVA